MPQSREELLDLLHKTYLDIDKIQDKLRLTLVDNFDDFYSILEKKSPKKNKKVGILR